MATITTGNITVRDKTFIKRFLRFKIQMLVCMYVVCTYAYPSATHHTKYLQYF